MKLGILKVGVQYPALVCVDGQQLALTLVIMEHSEAQRTQQAVAPKGDEVMGKLMDTFCGVCEMNFGKKYKAHEDGIHGAHRRQMDMMQEIIDGLEEEKQALREKVKDLSSDLESVNYNLREIKDILR